MGSSGGSTAYNPPGGNSYAAGGNYSDSSLNHGNTGKWGTQAEYKPMGNYSTGSASETKLKVDETKKKVYSPREQEKKKNKKKKAQQSSSSSEESSDDDKKAKKAKKVKSPKAAAKKEEKKEELNLLELDTTPS